MRRDNDDTNPSFIPNSCSWQYRVWRASTHSGNAASQLLDFNDGSPGIISGLQDHFNMLSILYAGRRNRWDETSPAAHLASFQWHKETPMGCPKEMYSLLWSACNQSLPEDFQQSISCWNQNIWDNIYSTSSQKWRKDLKWKILSFGNLGLEFWNFTLQPILWGFFSFYIFTALHVCIMLCSHCYVIWSRPELKTLKSQTFSTPVP